MLRSFTEPFNNGNLPENFDPSLLAFQGQIKVTGTDTDQLAIYDFLLVFHSGYGLILYSFQEKWQYLQNFPTSR